MCARSCQFVSPPFHFLLLCVDLSGLVSLSLHCLSVSLSLFLSHTLTQTHTHSLTLARAYSLLQTCTPVADLVTRMRLCAWLFWFIFVFWEVEQCWWRGCTAKNHVVSFSFFSFLPLCPSSGFHACAASHTPPLVLVLVLFLGASVGDCCRCCRLMFLAAPFCYSVEVRLMCFFSLLALSCADGYFFSFAPSLPPLLCCLYCCDLLSLLFLIYSVDFF